MLVGSCPGVQQPQPSLQGAKTFARRPTVSSSATAPAWPAVQRTPPPPPPPPYRHPPEHSVQASLGGQKSAASCTQPCAMNSTPTGSCGISNQNLRPPTSPCRGGDGRVRWGFAQGMRAGASASLQFSSFCRCKEAKSSGMHRHKQLYSGSGRLLLQLLARGTRLSSSPTLQTLVGVRRVPPKASVSESYLTAACATHASARHAVSTSPGAARCRMWSGVGGCCCPQLPLPLRPLACPGPASWRWHSVAARRLRHAAAACRTDRRTTPTGRAARSGEVG